MGIRGDCRLPIPVCEKLFLALDFADGHADIDKIIDVIERIRAPLDQRDHEEQIIKSEYVPAPFGEIWREIIANDLRQSPQSRYSRLYFLS
jgi:hypothetical protein